MRHFFRRLFMSPVQCATEDFVAMGMGTREAALAAHELWLACRCGLPTPRWIVERIDALHAAREP